MTILFFLGILSAILLFFLSDIISIKFFHNSDLIIFLKIFSFLVPIYIFTNIFLYILHAFEKIGWNSFILNILQNVVKLITLVLFLYLGLKTNAIIFSFFLGIFSMFLISFIIYKKLLLKLKIKKPLTIKDKKQIHKEFFPYSWPLLFSGILSYLLMWVDSFTLGYFKDASIVGLYNVAIPLVILLRFVPELFLKLFFPLVTKGFSKNNLLYVKELSKQVGKWIFIFNLPLLIIILLFPTEIITLLFGKEYIAVAIPLQILSIGYFIITSVFISQNLLTIAGKTKLILLNTIFSLVLNLILNILFIPKPFILNMDNSQGMIGAALATTIVNILSSVIILFQAKYYTSIIPIRKKMIDILFISFIPLFLIVFIKNYLILNFVSLLLLISLLLLLYSLLLLLTNSLDKKDFMILKIFGNRIFKIK